MPKMILSTALACCAGMLFTAPATAAPQANISFVTGDSSIFLNGGTMASCRITDPAGIKAEFTVENNKITLDVTNGTGTVVVSGTKSYTGKVTSVNVSSAASAFSLYGESDSGVKFISNGECA